MLKAVFEISLYKDANFAKNSLHNTLKWLHSVPRYLFILVNDWILIIPP